MPDLNDRTEAEDALRVDDSANCPWDDEADIVVVGFGGAGAVAAIHATEGGAKVIAIDRFNGGGATAYSGGIIYAGATAQQRAAGIQDSPENMAKYLALEVGNVVGQGTVRRYCAQSAPNLEWLQTLGVRFGSELFTGKTTYPPDGSFLYYSGNEKVDRYAAVAEPAARGHRTRGKGFTGKYLFAALRAAARQRGVRLQPYNWVRRLVVDRDDRVIGVETIEVAEAKRPRLQRLYDKINPMFPFKELKAEKASAEARQIERQFTRRRLVRARHGVILSTGGYVYNLPMLARHAPLLAKNLHALMRMGSLGDDGSAARLGQSVGARPALLDNMFVGRVLSPPSALLDGILVNTKGQRFVNEAIYLGSLGRAIIEQPDGRAWLILPRGHYRRAFRQILTGGWFSLKLFGVAALLNMLLGGTRRAPNLRALARKCDLDEAAFLATVGRYNALAAGRHDDDFSKLADHMLPIEDGPCVALNMSVENKYSFMQVFSLGGLPVDEANGAVIRPDGTPVQGLYAAGRAAIGLPSNKYISGLSLGDCVFSGRRAAEACLRGLHG